MKQWRIGTVSFGLFLILLGASLLLTQFNAALAAVLLRNWWPCLLIVLGAELVLSQYLILRRGETRYSYDLLSLLFVGMAGLISLGVYALAAAGVWDRLAEVAAGRLAAVEYRAELSPAGRIDKVLLDCGAFRQGSIRIWDSPDEAIHVKVRGLTTSGRPERESLAAAVQLEQVGRVVYLRLRGQSHEVPWRTQPDQVQIMIPKRLLLEAEEQDRLDLGEFHGRVARRGGEPLP